MSKQDILRHKSPNLETQTYEPPSVAPQRLKTNEITKLERVARPIRHVKYIPLKALSFRTKTSPIDFTYSKEIKLPVPRDKLVIEVSHAALNPIDLKIRNGYTKPLYGEIGLGREYCGVVTQVGDNIAYAWHPGDVVFGIYYHPTQTTGTLQSSILVDPRVDPVLLKPERLSREEAAGTLFCLGTAFNILDKLSRAKILTSNSNVLINGGTTSVGMFAIQLLKRYYKLDKKLVIVTSGNGPDVLEAKFPDLAGEMLFINYLSCRGKSSKPLKTMIQERKAIAYHSALELGQSDSELKSETEIEYTQGKFDVVLDFVGGYDILAHSSSLIHASGAYVTTVGDYVTDYSKDVFNSWDNPSASARKLFGSITLSFTYSHFYFDPKVSTAHKNDWINVCGKLLEDGTVTCVVDKVYDWSDINEAIDYMKTQRAQGKIVLKVEKF